MKHLALALEPFVEHIDETLDFDGAAGYRIGYRVGPGGPTITSIVVPAEIIEKTLNLPGSVGLAVTPDGHIAAISHSNSAAPTLCGAFPIDDLVKDALNIENLRMEEASPADLSAFLRRLEQSVSLVKEAIERMVGASKLPQV